LNCFKRFRLCSYVVTVDLADLCATERWPGRVSQGHERFQWCGRDRGLSASDHRSDKRARRAVYGKF